MTPQRKTERRFGDFELVQRIGRDGPFHLFRARQVDLGRLVMLKVLPERSVTLEQSALLRREAEATGRLDHIGAIRAFESGDVGGIPYLALAHVDGDLLSERLKANPLPPRLAIDLTRQLAEVLLHAHERGVIHGSLRPQVVWVTRDGQARLCGFGCPIQFEEIDAERVAGHVGYLAPEQAGGRGAISRATDVYGLGAILYAMLTGSPPHEGPTAAETCRQIRTQHPVRPSLVRPGLSETLDDICLKCLHVSPARRYGTDRPLPRLIADLRRARGGRTESDPWHQVSSWLRRHARLVRISALLLLFGVVPAAWDRQRRRSAWDTVSRADAAPEQYVRAARHFERQADDQPFDAEIAAGLTLARLRAGQPASGLPAEPSAWQNVNDEWAAIRKLAYILAALKEKRRGEARAELAAARAAGYLPRTERERRLLAECERDLAGE